MRALTMCLAILLLAGCGSGLIRPGGQYSGMPDTTIGDPQRNRTTGTISTDGTLWSREQGYLTTPRRY